MPTLPETPSEPPRRWLDYRAVWRWHFYAGLFCIPFVILLSITGTIYLFAPQIESWQDRELDNLHLTGSHRTAAEQIRAALDGTPGATFSEYEVPASSASAGRILLRNEGLPLRVYVHPETLQVLRTVQDNDRFVRVVRRLHGELLIGDRGSHLVELAACWTIILLLSGLYLWWPRKTQGLGGVIYPRLRAGGKTLWRDLHAVTGVWITLMALFLIVSGLPWANFWGEYFRGVRSLTGTSVARQDWSTRSATAGPEGASGDAGHDHGGGSGRGSRSVDRSHAPAADLTAVDRIVTAVAPLQLPPPVLIAPPRSGETWTVRSNTPNRPLRVTLQVDGQSGEIIRRENFSDRHWIDRAVGIGIAAHEGQLFGWLNQLLGVLTTTGLVLLSVSGVVLWWRRRNPGTLGAPEPGLPPQIGFGMVALVLAVGVLLPLFGASLVLVLLTERVALRRIPAVQRWLGLRVASAG